MPPQAPQTTPPRTKTQLADKKLLGKLTAEIEIELRDIESGLAKIRTYKRTASNHIKKSFTEAINGDKLVRIDFEATEKNFNTSIGRLLDGLQDIMQLARDVCDENTVDGEGEAGETGDDGDGEGDSDDEGEKGAELEGGESKKRKISA